MKNNEDLNKLQVDLTKLTSAVDALQAKCCPVKPAAAGSCPVALCSSPVVLCTTCASYVPDFAIPELAPGGGDHDPALLAKLGPLAGLIGTWVSGQTNGFNVMPIPQATAPNGFILKNGPYYEVMTFSAIQGKVANRGGTFEQDCYTLFYEQRVFFGDGPQVNTLVHAENGSWLHLITGPQGQGPLNTQPNIPSPPAPDPIPPQLPSTSIIKQVSVPHGNSILALGGCSTINGVPSIPVVSALPIDAPPSFSVPYGPDVPTNPNVNPNFVLQQALNNLPSPVKVLRTQVISVDSENNGDVANNPFIEKYADVSRFSTTLWLEELSNGQLQLQYSQNISLNLPQPDGKKILFPHITANTLCKVR